MTSPCIKTSPKPLVYGRKPVSAPDLRGIFPLPERGAQIGAATDSAATARPIRNSHLSRPIAAIKRVGGDVAEWSKARPC